eukprot:scaffold224224_cov28-Tisochrysis_lutea.AAC.3
MDVLRSRHQCLQADVARASRARMQRPGRGRTNAHMKGERDAAYSRWRKVVELREYVEATMGGTQDEHPERLIPVVFALGIDAQPMAQSTRRRRPLRRVAGKSARAGELGRLAADRLDALDPRLDRHTTCNASPANLMTSPPCSETQSIRSVRYELMYLHDVEGLVSTDKGYDSGRVGVGGGT